MSELPIGTVTFLFTDIEGSTRSLRELGEGYHAVQDLHAYIVREAITAEDGNEVRTEGDAFFVVFRTATHALRAAVRAQRELATANWPHGRGVRVRMGIPGRCARRRRLRRGGRQLRRSHRGRRTWCQILISDASRVLVEHTLPEGVAIRGLGTHALKDFGDPRALFDIVVDGLVCDFPPIRTLAGSAPTNIRPARTSFVGRERELAEIGDLLDRTRLVTLTGPGGTGKTRLELRAALSELQRFQDGAFVA